MAWDLMPVWQRTMEMLTSLGTWSINYYKRIANGAADLLAKYNLQEILEGRAIAFNEDQLSSQ